MGFAETFTVYENGVTGEDDDGNDVYGEIEREVCGAFSPSGSTEQVQGAAQVVTHDTLYLNEGERAPGAQDEMLVRGVRRQVEGTPGEYQHVFTGWVPGPVVRLKSVTG